MQNAETGKPGAGLGGGGPFAAANLTSLCKVWSSIRGPGGQVGASQVGKKENNLREGRNVCFA